MSDAAHGPAVDVAIVNWNTSATALAAAAAFGRSEGAEARVTVYDNASSDREILERCSGTGFRLILGPENAGYSAAANAALAEGSAPFVCVCNADVEPAPRMLAVLASVASRNPAAGMVGPVYSGGGNRHHATLPSPGVLLARLFAGRAGTRPPPVPRAGEVLPVEQPSGACFLMRRDAWVQIGGLDDGFFLWYEDVDLARRLLESGRQNLVAGAAVAHHSGGTAFALVPPERAQEIRLGSMKRYIDKHHPRLRAPAAPLLVLARALRAR